MLILVLKTLHVVSIIAWMAALLYLPRLFVYHADAEPGSDTSEIFKIMERRLAKAIMGPAMHASWTFGLALIWAYGWEWFKMAQWLHVKIALVIAMTVFHTYLTRRVKAFANDSNDKPARFYRLINEVPTVLMIAIVALVIIQPF